MTRWIAALLLVSGCHAHDHAPTDEAHPVEAEHDHPPGTIHFTAAQQARIDFRVDRATERTVRPSIPAFARLRLPSDAEAVVVAPYDGRLMRHGEHLPIVGAKVQRGDPLFGTIPQERGDPATLDLAVEKAGIQVKAAAREVQRLRPLVAQGVVARRRLDAARSTLSRARAGLRGAERHRSSLGHSQTLDGSVELLQIPSPISGTIAEVFVTHGAWVTAGQPVARVVDARVLWLEIALPEAYVDRLETVSGAWLRFGDAPLELGRDALVSVGAEVDPATRTLPILFRLPNPDGALFAGMATQAHLVNDAPRPAVTVPASALVRADGADVVFVQTGPDTFTRVPVRPGLRDGEVVAVEGLAAGAPVVSRGAWSVRLAALGAAAVGHGHDH